MRNTGITSPIRVLQRQLERELRKLSKVSLRAQEAVDTSWDKLKDQLRAIEEYSEGMYAEDLHEAIKRSWPQTRRFICRLLEPDQRQALTRLDEDQAYVVRMLLDEAYEEGVKHGSGLKSCVSEPAGFADYVYDGIIPNDPI